MTTLFHGTYSNTAPEVKIGKFSLGNQDNLFDGLFTTSSRNIAESHGSSVFTYTVDSIATNDDLDCDKAVSIIEDELMVDADIAEEIASAVAYEESLEDYAEYLDPRSEYDTDELGWEMQRLRGVIARELGFDAVECEDEHGISYLIVNKNIKGE